MKRWLLLLGLLACDDGASAPAADAAPGDSGPFEDVPLLPPDALERDARPVDAALDAADARVPDGAAREPVVAVLEAPATVAPCDVLVLDASLSTGRRLSFAWSAGDDAPPTLTQRLADAVGPVVVLPPDAVPAGRRYSFRVTVRDPAGRSDAVRVEVEKRPVTPPVVSIDGPEAFELRRSEALRLFGNARAAACDGSARLLGLEWLVDPALEVEAEGAVLELPPLTLAAAARYTFTLAAWPVEAPAQRAEATVEVDVVRGPLLAAIAGGDRLHPVGQPLVLDGSPSRDSDEPDAPLTEEEGYTFAWSCSREDLACGFELPDVRSVTIPGEALELGRYEFALRVSDGQREGRADARVVIAEGPCVTPAPPVVAIAGPGGKADPRRDLSLEGAVAPRGEEDPALEWIELSGLLDLDDPRIAPGGRRAPRLRVAAAALEPGAALQFRLEARDCAGVGAAERAVDVNAPPRWGNCAVDGAAEVAEGEVAVACRGWADEDHPLAYQAFAVPDEGPALPLTPAQEEPALRFLRPAEDLITVRVTDALGLWSEVEVLLP